MTWFKVDDSFYDHPKVYDAPDCAVALWIRAGCWAARNLTDGFVPSGMLARLCDDSDRAAKELVDRGLWKRTKGGYQFHDWSAYQPTRGEVQASRDKISSGGLLGAHRRWHAGKGVVDPECQLCQEEQTNPEAGLSDRGTDRGTHRGVHGEPNGWANAPDPSRPVQELQNTSPPDKPAEVQDLFGATEVQPPKAPPKPGTDGDPGWLAFWSAFPRKDGKAEARTAYANAVKKTGISAEFLTDAAQAYAERMQRDRVPRPKIKMPQGWLNGERWNDEFQDMPIRVGQQPWWA